MKLVLQMQAVTTVVLAHVMAWSIVVAGYWPLLVVPLALCACAVALWLCAEDA